MCGFLLSAYAQLHNLVKRYKGVKNQLLASLNLLVMEPRL